MTPEQPVSKAAYGQADKALFFAIHDYVWERLIDLDAITEEQYEWWDDNIAKPVMALLCRANGHTPIGDNCGIPDHDYCATCGEPLPGQAPRRPAVSAPYSQDGDA